MHEINHITVSNVTETGQPLLKLDQLKFECHVSVDSYSNQSTDLHIQIFIARRTLREQSLWLPAGNKYLSVGQLVA